MKRILLSTAVLSACVGTASAGLITTMTVTDSAGDHATASTSDYEFIGDTTLKDFTFAGTKYTNFNLVDSTDSERTQVIYQKNGTAISKDNAGVIESITDQRIDSSIVNVSNNDQFFFAATPLSLNDIVFFFELTEPVSATVVQMVTADGLTLLGNSVSLSSEWTALAITDTDGNFDLSNKHVNGAALTLAELGIDTAGELAQVGGFRVITANSIDLGLAGTASLVPEPASLVLLGLGGLCLLGGRRSA